MRYNFVICILLLSLFLPLLAAGSFNTLILIPLTYNRQEDAGAQGSCSQFCYTSDFHSERAIFTCFMYVVEKSVNFCGGYTRVNFTFAF
jgi:hypothetical protein